MTKNEYQVLENSIGYMEMDIEDCRIGIGHNDAALMTNGAGWMIDIKEAKRSLKALRQYVKQWGGKVDEIAAYNKIKRDDMNERFGKMKRSEPAQKRHQKVYVLHNIRNGYYKIGRSFDVPFREKTLQSEEPEIELLMNVVAPASMERELHAKYSDKRVRGEWFRLDESDIIQLSELFAAQEKSLQQ